jgi:hypothetical protein
MNDAKRLPRMHIRKIPNFQVSNLARANFCKIPKTFLRRPSTATVPLLSFPKIQSGGIRAVRQNQRIILRDARIPSAAWKVCRQSVQAAAAA